MILLRNVGDEVPDSWKGTLDITYRIGNKGFKGNNTAIRIEVNFPNRKQDIYNVIGTIYGREEPDRWVMIGNHRDAWGFGAVDPSSGTATMMEISRGLSMLLMKGNVVVWFIQNKTNSENRHLVFSIFKKKQENDGVGIISFFIPKTLSNH